MNHCHLNDWRKFSHMPHFTTDRPLWSALIVCFTALTLNALREKTTLECLILHSICTSFFIHSVSFTKVQATRCDNQYNFSWPRKLVDTFGFIGRFWAETLWEPHFFLNQKKKSCKSWYFAFYGYVFVAWASRFSGPTALRISFYILHCEVCRKVKNLKALLFVRSELRRGWIPSAWLHRYMGFNFKACWAPSPWSAAQTLKH